MVVEQETRKADVLERPHGGDHVAVTLAQEALLEAGNRPLHIAEMHVDNRAATRIVSAIATVHPHVLTSPTPAYCLCRLPARRPAAQ
jgi:hypothetical protein